MDNVPPYLGVSIEVCVATGAGVVTGEVGEVEGVIEGGVDVGFGMAAGAQDTRTEIQAVIIEMASQRVPFFIPFLPFFY